MFKYIGEYVNRLDALKWSNSTTYQEVALSDWLTASQPWWTISLNFLGNSFCQMPTEGSEQRQDDDQFS